MLKQVTIVGLGLIGGSLGMALKRRRLAREVVGLSRDAATVRRARQRRAIDWGGTDARRAVGDAEVVVLATPVETLVPQARWLAGFMPTGSILSDVGSIKGDVVNTLERALPSSVAFVGAHPLAGSEQRGIDAARADLFDGAVCVVTSTRRTNPRALAAVKRLWRPLVRRVVVMEPGTHDRLMAQVSHLPHLLAFCLAASADPHALSLAPRSFLEATRVAKSDPELWDDILLGNRTALLEALERFDHSVQRIRHALDRRDQGSLRRLLHQAQALRQTLHD